jgi:hypothetical protein
MVSFAQDKVMSAPFVGTICFVLAAAAAAFVFPVVLAVGKTATAWDLVLSQLNIRELNVRGAAGGYSAELPEAEAREVAKAAVAAAPEWHIAEDVVAAVAVVAFLQK